MPSGQRVACKAIITRWPVLFLSSRRTCSAHHAALSALLNITASSIMAVHPASMPILDTNISVTF